MILFFIILPFSYLLIKLILQFVVWKFGKISYEGFSAAGFKFRSEDNLFYSSHNAWQKKYGYCHLYDVTAPLFRMIIDTEVIRFYYREANWLITFWKGQYGITTGAEIGIYKTKQFEVDRNTLYLPVRDDEMLDMKFTIFKKEQEIMSISKKHWWLAAFKLGMFSRPKDLVMDIQITFPNKEMLDAFLTSFKKLRHRKKSYSVSDNTFSFTYKRPHTRKVWTRGFLRDHITQYLNHRNVKLYNKYLIDLVDDGDSPNSIPFQQLVPSIIQNKEEKQEISNSIYLRQEASFSPRDDDL